MIADGRAASEEMEFGPFWRLRMNTIRERLEGWLSYGR